MKQILSLAIICFSCITLYSQSGEENAIKQQLRQFEQAHNRRNLDSMMLIVSNNYEEIFLPDIQYNARSFRNYYKNLIGNTEYRSILKYNVEDVEANGKTASSDVTWDYIIFPTRGTDTLYYAKNKGTIQWIKEGESWKMKKTFAGNLREVNNFINHSKKQAIQTELLDWISYYNNKDITNVMELYSIRVKGLSSFNGSYIFYDDLQQEYENLFNSSKLRTNYELEGLEELKFSGDLAYTLMVWKYSVHDVDRNIFNQTRYRDLSVWEFQESGHWKIVSFVRKEIEQ